MKFLQEMIAKKRAQQEEEDVVDTSAPTPGVDGFVAADMPHAVSADAFDAPEVTAEEPGAEDAHAPHGTDDVHGYEDPRIDDGSYDWDLEDEAEDPEDLAQGAPAPHPFEVPNPVAAHSEYDDEDDDEDDMNYAASMVLKDIVARSQADDFIPQDGALQDGTFAQDTQPSLPPEAPQSPVEQQVQKLRVQRKIWDMDAETDEPLPEAPDLVSEDPAMPDVAGHPEVAAEAQAPSLEPTPAPEPQAEHPAPSAAPNPQSRRGGRVKTRILGFHKPEEATPDPFAAPQVAAIAPGDPQFPVGWMVVVEGPGRGASFTLTAGASKIGRGEDQAIRLDYGDTSISRDNHAAVAYDNEQHCFFIGHGGKANLVRLNDMPVLSTEPLSDGDDIRIGETTLRFVAFCGPDFSWDGDGDGDSRYAAAE
ncbi:MAG: FHA domain-containing protein [Pseudomonadota bacterium]